MPLFQYTGCDSSGQVVNGKIEGTSTETVRESFKAQGLLLFDIKELAGADSAKKGFKLFYRKIKTKDIVVLTQQLASMLDSGLNLVHIISILSEQTENRRLKAVLDAVRVDLERGTSFSQALAKHPNVFSNIFVSMVKAGEEGGIIDKVMVRMSSLLESQEYINSKVKGAMIYPIIVLSLIFLFVNVFVIFIVPRFIVLFDSAKVKLPLPTLLLYKTSIFMQHSWYIIVFLIIAAIFAIRSYKNTYKGRRKIDAFILKLPVMKVLIMKRDLAFFSRILGALTTSGLPVTKAMEVVENTVSNSLYSDAIRVSKEDIINNGVKLNKALTKSKVFPPFLVHMVAVGEESGTVDKMLLKTADFFDKDLENLTKNISTTIEPFLLLTMGLAVGYIAVALFLPLFKVGTLFTG